MHPTSVIGIEALDYIDRFGRDAEVRLDSEISRALARSEWERSRHLTLVKTRVNRLKLTAVLRSSRSAARIATYYKPIRSFIAKDD